MTNVAATSLIFLFYTIIITHYNMILFHSMRKTRRRRRRRRLLYNIYIYYYIIRYIYIYMYKNTLTFTFNCLHIILYIHKCV